MQIWCNTFCDDTYDIHDIARYQTVLLKLEEIISFISYTKSSAVQGFLLCGASRTSPPTRKSDKAVRFAKTLPSLFTFGDFYDIIALVRYLINKLEFKVLNTIKLLIIGRNYDNNKKRS